MTKSLIENLLARVLYYSGLIKIVRDKGQKHPKILVFHSVSQIENDFVKGTEDVWISNSLFKEHLSYIRKYYNIISLQTLVESLKDGKITERSVVITFDDGFADNYHFAYPILKEFRIPATIFLATETIDNSKPIWIQKLNYLINKFSVEQIIDELKNIAYHPRFEVLVQKEKPGESLDKKVEQFFAYKITKTLRDEILAKLYAEFDISMEKVFTQNNIFLSWEQIKKMCGNGISFGNHGMSHTPFSVMPDDEQKDEVMRSKNMIEQHISQDFLPFAYPFGQKRDFTGTTKRFIDDAGHDCILTATPTLIDSSTSLQELGRIVVGNIPVYRLAFQLEKAVFKTVMRF